MRTLIVCLLSLCTLFSYAQNIDYRKFNLVPPDKVQEGYMIMDVIVGEGDDIYVVWVNQFNPSVYLAKNSISTGALVSTKEMAIKGTRRFFYMNGKLLMLNYEKVKETMVFTYGWVDVKGNPDAELKELATVAIAKKGDVKVKFSEKTDGGIIILTYTENNWVEKYIQNPIAIIEVDKTMKPKVREQDIPVEGKFLINNFEADEEGNINGLLVKLTEEKTKFVKETFALSIRKKEETIVMVPLQIEGLEIVDADWETKKGRTVFAGFAASVNANERLNERSYAELPSLVTFLMEVDFSAQKVTSSTENKLSAEMLTELQNQLVNATKTEKIRNAKFETKTFISAKGEVSIVGMVSAQWIRSTDMPEFYQAGILVFHYDNGTGFKWSGIPEKRFPTALIPRSFKPAAMWGPTMDIRHSITQDAKGDIYILYAVGYKVISQAVKAYVMKDTYVTAAAITDKGIVPAFTTEEENQINIGINYSPMKLIVFFPHRTDKNKFIIINHDQKEPYEMTILESK